MSLVVCIFTARRPRPSVSACKADCAPTNDGSISGFTCVQATTQHYQAILCETTAKERDCEFLLRPPQPQKQMFSRNVCLSLLLFFFRRAVQIMSCLRRIRRKRGRKSFPDRFSCGGLVRIPFPFPPFASDTDMGSHAHPGGQDGGWPDGRSRFSRQNFRRRTDGRTDGRHEPSMSSCPLQIGKGRECVCRGKTTTCGLRVIVGLDF